MSNAPASFECHPVGNDCVSLHLAVPGEFEATPILSHRNAALLAVSLLNSAGITSATLDGNKLQVHG